MFSADLHRARTEYTPEDDEFLCRYLAAFHPSGAWGSRKTYEVMVGYQMMADS